MSNVGGNTNPNRYFFSDNWKKKYKQSETSKLYSRHNCYLIKCIKAHFTQDNHRYFFYNLANQKFIYPMAIINVW